MAWSALGPPEHLAVKTHHAIIATSVVLLVAGAGFLGADCAGPIDDHSATLTSPAASSCEAYAITRCERMDQCSAGSWIGRFFGTVAACEEHVAEECALGAAAPGTSVTAASIDACTAALSDATCAEFFGGVAACHPGPGSRPTGASCTYALQCESAWCERAPGAGCGVCEARLPRPPPSVPCGTSMCTPPSFCIFGQCAIPIANQAAPRGYPNLGPTADPNLAGRIVLAPEQTACEGGCAEGSTCMQMTIPSIDDPTQITTHYGCAPVSAEPIAVASALTTLAEPAAPVGPYTGIAPIAPPPIEGHIQIEIAPGGCEGGCAAGYTCMSMTIPSLSGGSDLTTRYGCAPIGSDRLECAHYGMTIDPTTGGCALRPGVVPLEMPAAPTPPVTGLAPGEDPRLAGRIVFAPAQHECEGGCGAGYTCMSMTIPSLSNPSETTTQYGCAPVTAEVIAVPSELARGAVPTEPFPAVGPLEDPRLAGRIVFPPDQRGCEDRCGVGFRCVSITIPSVSDPSHATTRYGCAPMTRDALACVRAGLLLDPATGECQWPVIASPGEPCGASRPGVVCGEWGRCHRATPNDMDGVCIAAAPVGGECFVDPSQGAGCMAPAYCARAAGAPSGICTSPVPASCGD
jgi:hypothetical protein